MSTASLLPRMLLSVASFMSLDGWGSGAMEALGKKWEIAPPTPQPPPGSSALLELAAEFS